MSYNNITIDNNDVLSEFNKIQKIIIIFFSSFSLALYFFSLLFMIFYLKKIVYIKAKYYNFILVSSITGLIDLYLNKKEFLFIKIIILFFSKILQFHLIISSINKMLYGKHIFKAEKDFTIKNLLLINIIILPIIIFPYEKIFTKYINKINFFQNLIILISILYFYEYVKKYINNLLNYLKEIPKDNILIPYMESEELIEIYKIIDNFWLIIFVFGLIYYIIKLFDLLLIKITIIHFCVYLILIIIESSLVFIFFFCFTYITYILNKNYDKGEYVQTEEDESHLSNNVKNKTKNENENESNEIEISEINIKNEKSSKTNNKYKSLENSEHEDNVIEIDNFDIPNANGKDNKNNEEEKLDDEEENNTLKDKKYKETDKLK